MTQEEKDLLLRDLCARVPHGVRVLVQSHKGTFNGTLVTVTTKLSNTLGEAWIEETNEALWCDYKLFKPYLRPMSSMTEKEYESVDWEDCRHVIYYDKNGFFFVKIDSFTTRIFDWLKAHHFDYRGLIPMGLALEAPEDMYKTK